MAASEDFEIAGLQFERHRASDCDSLRDASHVCSASLRIIGTMSVNSRSRSNVSSAEMDCVGLSGITSPLSIPRDNS